MTRPDSVRGWRTKIPQATQCDQEKRKQECWVGQKSLVLTGLHSVGQQQELSLCLSITIYKRDKILYFLLIQQGCVVIV